MTPISSLGIDLSTSATGLVLLRENGAPRPDLLHEEEIKPDKVTGVERSRFIVAHVMELIHGRKPDKIMIEGYSLNMKKASSVIPLVEVGGLLRFMLHLDGFAWYDPRAAEVKKFATGKGNTTKAQMMMHVLKRWGHESKSDNTADAFALAALGLAQANRLPGITMEMRKIAGSLPLRKN
ncbi:MAG: crossover junction endodeoxyribonuclease RuvC [Burkholderiaceae bacterium]|nr:crossover junction endodeoxyribonuclease RuvC [Burkholderiaceae bacterium]